MDTSILEKWLKCGFVEANQLFPTEEGTPQGGTISPTLMNMTLDGLEELLHERIPDRYVGGKKCFNGINFVRYADDFIITGKTPELLQNEVPPIVQEFLKERGLQLSEEKTLITHIDEGFDFLGKNIRKYNGKLLIKPSKSSVKAFLGKVRSIIKDNKSATQEMLIRKLNPVIRGWVNNQRFVVSSVIFGTVDYQIYKCLWQWCKRRHKRKSNRWIAAKYFHHIGNRHWTFSAPIKSQKKGSEARYVKLEYATDTKITRFKKITAQANPFDGYWSTYFEEREGEMMLHNAKARGTLFSIWKKQKHRCPVCGNLITSETGFKIHISTGSNTKIMVHADCHKQLHNTLEATF